MNRGLAALSVDRFEGEGLRGGPRLYGRRVALAETRELDRLAALFEGEGAAVVRCPLVSMMDTPDREAVLSWLRLLVAGRFDVVVFLTGEGVVRLVDAADRAGLRGDVLRALDRVTKLGRGPKPGRALHDLGLACDLTSDTPTSEGVASTLAAMPLEGRHVGLQLFGDDPSAVLTAELVRRGAHVHAVAPYRYAPASDDARVVGLIEMLAAGALDVMVFTVAAQVERLFAVARRHGAEPALRTGLARTQIAAVGPVVVDALGERGVRVDHAPTRHFFMRRLVDSVAVSCSTSPGHRAAACK